MIGAGAAFVSALKRRPVLLNSAAGFVLFASSDAFAQEVERHGVRRLVPFHRPLSEKEKHIASEFSWPRLTSAGMLGIFFGGFVYPLAYARLDTLWPGTKFRQVVSKSVAEIFTDRFGSGVQVPVGPDENCRLNRTYLKYKQLLLRFTQATMMSTTGVAS
jgi:hypothetical protein